MVVYLYNVQNEYLFFALFAFALSLLALAFSFFLFRFLLEFTQTSAHHCASPPGLKFHIKLKEVFFK